MPYDQYSSVGYIITLTVQTVAVMKFCAIFCPINALYISVCRYIEIFTDDLTVTLNSIDDINRLRNEPNNIQLTLEMKRKFIEVTGFHIDILK